MMAEKVCVCVCECVSVCFAKVSLRFDLRFGLKGRPADEFYGWGVPFCFFESVLLGRRGF